MTWARAGSAGCRFDKERPKSRRRRLDAQQLVEAYFSKREHLVGPALAIAQAHVVRLGEELRGRSVQIEIPSFGVEVYERVLSSAQPRSGPTLAYYILAGVYDLLGETAAAQEALRRAVHFLDQDTVSKSIFPLIIKRCLESISGTEEDRGPIRSARMLYFDTWRLKILLLDPPWPFAFFLRQTATLSRGTATGT